MTVKELINKLEEFDGDLQIMVYDSVYEAISLLFQIIDTSSCK